MESDIHENFPKQQIHHNIERAIGFFRMFLILPPSRLNSSATFTLPPVHGDPAVVRQIYRASVTATHSKLTFALSPFSRPRIPGTPFLLALPKLISRFLRVCMHVFGINPPGEGRSHSRGETKHMKKANLV